MVATLFFIGFSALAINMTGPDDLSGQWQGEQWKTLALSSVEEASHWYSGNFIDDEGRRGAVNLEWSRLQQRYNGRWKVGDNQTGSITLRVGKSGELRGAISIDPDAKAPANQPRLREFAWKRSTVEAIAKVPVEKPVATPATAEVGNPNHPRIYSLTEAADSASEQPTIDLSKLPEGSDVIKAHVDMRFVGFMDGIAENAKVKRSQPIAELDFDRRSGNANLRVWIFDAEKRRDAASEANKAETARLEQLHSAMDIARLKMTYATEVRKQLAAESEAKRKSVEAELQAAKNGHRNRLAKVEAVKQDLERVQKMHEKAFVTDAEVKEAEQEVRLAEETVAVYALQIESAEAELKKCDRDHRLKLIKAEMESTVAEAELVQAKTDLDKVNSQVELLQKQMKTAEKSIALYNKRLNDKYAKCYAEFNGRVIHLRKDLINLKEGESVPLKKGDVICVVVPEKAELEEESSRTDKANATVAP